MDTHRRAHTGDASLPAAESRASHQSTGGRWLAYVLGTDRHTRIRIRQWLAAAMTYLGSSVVLTMDHYLGWLPAKHLVAWLGVLAITQSFFYIAMRSGWSARFKDPALTVVQILTGVLFADWAFLIAGPGRATALLALLIVLIFGAFLVHWKKVVMLTCFALLSFGASLAALQWLRWLHPGTATRADLYQDVLYFATLVVMLPMTGVLAAQLSHLRSTLRTQRSALATALADVQRLAEFDALTGLANRRRADEYLTMQRAQSQRNGSGFAVVLIDLDNFKRINDTLGHDAGDKTLRAFADLTRPLMRTADLMARWGGEEFLVVMPDTSKDAASKVASRLLERARALPANNGEPLSFSAGIACWRPDESIANTVARADQRMYAAKHAGRNRIHTSDCCRKSEEKGVRDNLINEMRLPLNPVH